MTKVSIVECGSYEQEKVNEAVREAIENTGFEIKQGMKVLVKPNLLDDSKPEACVVTHYSIVEAICKILEEKKCNITIGDGSSSIVKDGAMGAFETSGIGKVGRKYNARMINLEKSKPRIIKEKSEVLEEVLIAEDIFEHDLIINLSKMKTHSLTKMTGAVKNMYGALPRGLKEKYHVIGSEKEDFNNIIIDIYKQIKPKLNIMDAVMGLEGEGPGRRGIPKKTGLILASEDAVALDLVAAQIMGFKALEVDTNRIAVKRNIFPGVKNVKVVAEKELEDYIMNYKKPLSVKQRVLPGVLNKAMMKLRIIYPKINYDKCTRCGLCAKACPKSTISFKKKPVIHKKNCISCFCCVEICPEGAIGLKRSVIFETAKKIRNKLK